MYHYLLSTTIFLIFNLISAQDIGQNLNNNAKLEQFSNQQQSQISIDFPSSLHNGNLHPQQQQLIPQTIKSTDKTSIFPSSQLPFDGVPPGFETVLPIEVLQKLRELHKNTNIPLMQKQSEFDKIMTSVSPKLLAKLPLPHGFEALPSNIKEKIKEINGDPSIDWSKKRLKVKELIGTLPQQQHPHPHTPLHNPSIRTPSTQIQQTNSGNVIPEFFPPNPPPGFEKVLPPEIYQQLLQIHRSPQLTVQQKSLQIDQIMRSLPQNIIDNLPLPPGFDKLPPKYIKEVRKIFGDKSLNFQEKDQKIVEFVHSLPLELRKLTRPPLPPAFEKLNFETKEKISNLFDDITLDDKQRQNNFWKIVNQLPEDEKAKVNEAFKFPF